jgi:hypothetical protein
MSNLVCFIYTEVTDIYHIDNENKKDYFDENSFYFPENDITKKNLYYYPRMVALNYEIGYYEKDKFISTKKIRSLINPKTMFITPGSIQYHNITQEDAEKNGLDISDILNVFNADIFNKINIIIGYNIQFHLKILLAEAIRNNIYLDFSKYIIIDIKTFNHNYQFNQLIELYNILYPKKSINNSINMDLIKLIFIKLYKKLKK